MDCKKTGLLIYKLRKENNMTQADVANELNISDKTISKWERGLGCPDVSLLTELSKLFNVDLNKLLIGDLRPNPYSNGNMKTVDFYSCGNCNNIMFGLNEAEIYCCGRRLEPLNVQSLNGEHNIEVSEIDGAYFLESNHPMTKEHYFSFIAYVVDGGVTILKLYPEQNFEVRIPKQYKMDLYVYCIRDGLFKVKI